MPYWYIGEDSPVFGGPDPQSIPQVHHRPGDIAPRQDQIGDDVPWEVADAWRMIDILDRCATADGKPAANPHLLYAAVYAAHNNPPARTVCPGGWELKAGTISKNGSSRLTLMATMRDAAGREVQYIVKVDDCGYKPRDGLARNPTIQTYIGQAGFRTAATGVPGHVVIESPSTVGRYTECATLVQEYIPWPTLKARLEEIKTVCRDQPELLHRELVAEYTNWAQCIRALHGIAVPDIWRKQYGSYFNLKGTSPHMAKSFQTYMEYWLGQFKNTFVAHSLPMAFIGKEQVKNMLDMLGQEIRLCTVTTACFTHGDMKPDNILRDPVTHQYALIDLDNAGPGHLAMELARFLFSDPAAEDLRALRVAMCRPEGYGLTEEQYDMVYKDAEVMHLMLCFEAYWHRRRFWPLGRVAVEQFMRREGQLDEAYDKLSRANREIVQTDLEMLANQLEADKLERQRTDLETTISQQKLSPEEAAGLEQIKQHLGDRYDVEIALSRRRKDYATEKSTYELSAMLLEGRKQRDPAAPMLDKHVGGLRDLEQRILRAVDVICTERDGRLIGPRRQLQLAGADPRQFLSYPIRRSASADDRL